MKIKSPIRSDYQLFGFDPGTTNLGIAWILNSYAYLYEISMNRNPDPIKRILDIQTVLQDTLNYFLFRPWGVIEGASYGKSYRQVELAEVRTTIAIWALDHNMSIHIMPPNTIRKEVFGDGKMLAHEYWTDLPPNAAAALSCAVACTKL